jgi:hypothetical protein
VHSIHNSSTAALTFLAILSPAEAPGPFLIDCYEDEPWRTLRAPLAYAPVRATREHTKRRADAAASTLQRTGRWRSHSGAVRGRERA